MPQSEKSYLYCPAQVYGELSNSQESIQSRSGVLFFLSVNQMMLSIMSIIMTFPLERAAFIRENRAGMCPPPPLPPEKHG